jgi:hypothetical protein
LASQIAEEDRNPAALTNAEANIAKVLGLSVERHEHGTPGAFNEASTTQALADAMLREANPGLGNVSEAMRGSMLLELARHADAVAAIAHDTAAPSPFMG